MTTTIHAYRFTSPYGYGSHIKNFSSDDEAFKYDEGMDDSAAMTVIEKLIGSDWFGWNIEAQRWQYLAKIATVEAA